MKEDAGLGRVYLPREDFARFGIDTHALTNGTAPSSLRPLMEFEAQRAREYYRAAEELLPLINDDSQAAPVDVGGDLSPLARANRRPQLRRVLRPRRAQSSREAGLSLVKGWLAIPMSVALLTIRGRARSPSSAAGWPDWPRQRAGRRRLSRRTLRAPPLPRRPRLVLRASRHRRSSRQLPARPARLLHQPYRLLSTVLGSSSRSAGTTRSPSSCPAASPRR